MGMYGGIFGPLFPYTYPSWFPWSPEGGRQISLPDGWGLCCDNGAQPKLAYRINDMGSICAVWGCTLNLQVPTGPIENFTPDQLIVGMIGPPWARSIAFTGVAFGRETISGDRMSFDEVWVEPAPVPWNDAWGDSGAPDAITHWPGYDDLMNSVTNQPGLFMPPVAVGFLPAIAPDLMPINQPMSDPLPAPLNAPGRVGLDGGLTPTDPYTGFPVGSPKPFVPTMPYPPTGQYLPPYELPSLNIDIRPNAPIVSAPGGSGNIPPPPGDKERKYRSPMTAGIRGILAGATGGNDAIGAFYDSLPSKLRRWKGRDGKWRNRDISPQTKLARLLQNSKDIDLPTALENLLKNEFEDRVIGGLSKGIQRNYSKMPGGGPRGRLPIGWQAGPAL